MKTRFTPPQFKLTIKVINLLISSLLCISMLTVDGQVITGPGVQWLAEHWYDDNGTIGQDASGEDWYYDFKPYLDETDAFVGYIAAGFSDVVNETLPGADCVNCGEDEIVCQFFETSTYQLGCSRPKLSEFDLLGEVEWYFLYGPANSNGHLRSVVQTETGYVAVGQITYEGGADIPYNYHVPPGTGSPLAECTAEEASPYTLLYLLQTDMEGESPVERVYGWAAPEDAGLYASEGYQILEDVDGSGFLIMGITEVDIERVDGPSGYLTRAWVIKIDEDLEIEWQHTYELSLPSAVSPVPWSTAYCGIELGDYYYIGCTQVLENDFDESLIHIIKLDKVYGSLVTDYVIDESRDADCLTPISPYTVAHNRAFELIENDGDILVAASIQRNKWWGATEVKGMATVYRIDISATPAWTLDVIPVTLSGTFDLKTGITNTSDGGFAVTTTVHAGDLDLGPYPYDKEYVEGEYCEFQYESNHQDSIVNVAYWNADTYVAKFDASDDMEWEQTYPTTSEPYDEYVMFPNDIKRMECMYHIIEAPDGGLAIAGNNSMNFDDDLVIKLYNDCNRYVTYNTGSGDINVTGTYTISTDVTWNANKKVRGIIEIEDDATLTINNSAIIQFADSKADAIPTYIRVKRGGRLVLEGAAKLTGNTACGTMWEGIYVEGTYGTNHPTPASLLTSGYFVTGDAHGLVKISGEATIEHARSGVTLGLPPDTEDYPDYGGGILIADNGNFHNNTIDVMMWPFDKNNVTFIRHCDFTTSAALPDPVETPEAHIKMIQVKNVNIRGNVFENSTAPTVYSNVHRGMGILGYNATFKANDNPNGFAATGGTGSDPNYFTDLYYGVYAAQFTTLSTNILVQGNVFAENGSGIYIGGATLPEVNFNTITLPSKSNYGIYLDGCDAYGVEENTITGAGANLLGTQIGIVINESGNGSNWIYRNNLSALKYGVRMQGNNGDTDDGLEIKCNTFDEGKYDISLISGATTATMKKNQGACGTLTSPASNLFTDPSFADINMQIKISADITTANYYTYTFHLDEDQGDAPFAAPADLLYSDSFDPLPPGDAEEFGCDDYDEVVNLLFEDYCPTNFTSGSGGSGRMAAPGPRKKRPANLMMSLTYNPYEYLKPAGVAYEAFLANLRFNMLASHYMQLDNIDSLVALIDESEFIIAKSLNAQISTEAFDFAAAEEMLSDLSTDESADSKGYDSPLSGIGIELAADTLTWLQSDALQITVFKEEAIRDDREGIQAKLLIELLDGDNYIEPINELNEEVTADELRYIQSNFPPAPVNSIQVYPHPVSTLSFVEIHLVNVQKNTRFIITDMQGRLISQFPVDNAETFIKIDNSQLEPGTYIGYISGYDGERISRQIVVVQ